jgi:protein-S-isoprenylcysteine O-methyltransferase Ste14
MPTEETISAPPTAQPAAPSRWMIGLDYFERLLLAGLYLVMLRHFAPQFADRPYNMIYVVAETFVMAFVLFRRTGQISRSPVDWIIGFLGSAGPMFVIPSGQALAPTWVGAGLMLLGLITHVSAKFTLRGSFGIVAANRGVKIGGPYRFVRHPMYLGYVIEWIGFTLANADPWNYALYIVTFGLQLYRILAEEKMLSRDPAFLAYRERVRFKLIPGVL